MEIPTVTDLLDEIENETLYRVLLTVDRRTLQIILLKMQGYEELLLRTEQQLEKSYFPYDCHEVDCDWYGSCNRLKWVWQMKSEQIPSNRKTADYCRFKKASSVKIKVTIVRMAAEWIDAISIDFQRFSHSSFLFFIPAVVIASSNVISFKEIPKTSINSLSIRRVKTSGFELLESKYI